MSDVKRYKLRRDMPATAWDFLPSEAVDASDFDALQQRCRDLEAERDSLKFALSEWFDKTEWVQQELSAGLLPAKYLGRHRADVMRPEVERLQAIVDRQEQQIAALTAAPNGWQAGYDQGRQDGTKTRLSELEQERRINRELRDQLMEQREDYAIGAALQRAAGELPEGYEIRVEVERGAGTVRLFGPEGDGIEGIEADTLADEINEAIDAAMESQACANTAGSSPEQ